MLRIQLQQIVAGLAIWCVASSNSTHAQSPAVPPSDYAAAAKARISALEAELRALRSTAAAEPVVTPYEPARLPTEKRSASAAVPFRASTHDDQFELPAAPPEPTANYRSTPPARIVVSPSEAQPAWRRRGPLEPPPATPGATIHANPFVRGESQQTETTDSPPIVPTAATVQPKPRNRLVIRETPSIPAPPESGASAPSITPVAGSVPAAKPKVQHPTTTPGEEEIAQRMERLEKELRALRNRPATKPPVKPVAPAVAATEVSTPANAKPSQTTVAKSVVAEKVSANSNATADDEMETEDVPDQPAAQAARPGPEKPSDPIPVNPFLEDETPAVEQKPATPETSQSPAATPATAKSSVEKPSQSVQDRQNKEREEAEQRTRRLNEIAEFRKTASSAIEPASASVARTRLQSAQAKPQIAPPPPPDPYGDDPAPANSSKPVAPPEAPSKSAPVASAAPAVTTNSATNCEVCPPRAPRVSSRSNRRSLMNVLEESQFRTAFESSGTTLYAGYDLMFVQPSFGNADALQIQTGAATGYTQDFDYGFELTPRIVGGFVLESGLGGRFQFWQYDHAAQAASGPSNGVMTISSPTITPGGTAPANLSLVANAAGQSLRAEHSLQLATYDFEGTKQLRVGSNAITLGGGARYLKMEQRYDVQRIDANGDLSGDLSHDHDFEGFGPTLGAEWLSPLGDSGLAFYASARGSILFGTRDQTVTRHDTAAPVLVRDDHLDQGAQIGIGEVGVGLQYEVESLVLRAGYEAQLWTDVGSATSATGNMGLQGLFASFGFSY